jgi:hypothetical protein
MGKIKKHFKDHSLEYIAGAGLALTFVGLALYGRQIAKNPAFNMLDYMDKLRKVDPSININDLKWVEIPAKQFMASFPDELDPNSPIAEIITKRVGPIIYGGAVVFIKGEELVAVFPK